MIAQFTQKQNEVTQKILSVTHNKQVVEEDLATSEQGILDFNSSVHLEDTVVNNFSREETVPLDISANRDTSKDYKACIHQNGHQFGYIPLNDLKLCHGPELHVRIPLLFYKHTN